MSMIKTVGGWIGLMIAAYFLLWSLGGFTGLMIIHLVLGLVGGFTYVSFKRLSPLSLHGIGAVLVGVVIGAIAVPIVLHMLAIGKIEIKA